jgi:hypothetical protein
MMSVSSTCKNSPAVSPKSPPNSPNTELVHFEDSLKGVIVNKLPGDVQQLQHGEEPPFDWRSRPNTQPPRSWRIASSSGSCSKASSGCLSETEDRRQACKGPGSDVDSRLMTALVATNLVTFTCGVVLGYWLYKRGLTRILDSGNS